jgi:tape measure domain-containing protein
VTSPGGDDLLIRAAIRDELSGGLEDIRRELAELGRQSGRTSRDVDDTARSMTRAERAGALLGRTAARAGLAMGRAGRDGALKMAHGLRELTGRAAGAAKLGLLGIGTAATVAGGALVTMAVKSASANQQAMISFTTMLGSAKKAGAFLSDLKKFAAATPFEFPELQTAASSLISAGVESSKVIPIMRTLGDVTSGMGTGSEGVKRATVALQQMNAAGKITGEDLNQLRDAGIPVYDLLAKATGKSKKAVAELAQKGKLGSKELGQMMTALESGKGLERFSGLMDKQSKSLAGVWSTLKDTVSQGLGDALTPLLPTLTGLVGKAGELAARVMPKLGTGLAFVVAKASALWPKLVGLWATFRDNGSLESVKSILGSIGHVLGSLAPSAGGAGGAMEALRRVLSALSIVFAVLARHTTAVKVVVLGLAMVFGGPVTAILALGAAVAWAYAKFPIFRKIVDTAIGGIISTFQFLLRAIGAVLGALGHIPGFGWAKKAAGAVNDLAKSLDGVKDALAGIPSRKDVLVTARLEGDNAAKAVLARGGTAVDAAKARHVATKLAQMGDTRTSRARGTGALGKTLAAHARYSASTGARTRITNALVGGGGKGHGSGDHQRGRALDLTGSGLASYGAAVRRDGGYADFHGTGAARHLHAVPAGDTRVSRARPIASSSSSSSSSGGVTIMPGAIVVEANGLDEAAARRVATHAIRAYLLEREERA